ncbi:hypothetical protein AVEN_33592-1 [Araneus ventricosus]|uniref:Uncharacterized protein n=1 Tax=Araneus ventricosus TaxID=182803 RepID=A0A4Y2XB70_ARAVE|nr:hypothetical protein AVEN_33592-1 [Araneus ventricosus]
MERAAPLRARVSLSQEVIRRPLGWVLGNGMERFQRSEIIFTISLAAGIVEHKVVSGILPKETDSRWKENLYNHMHATDERTSMAANKFHSVWREIANRMDVARVFEDSRTRHLLSWAFTSSPFVPTAGLYSTHSSR